MSILLKADEQYRLRSRCIEHSDVLVTIIRAIFDLQSIRVAMTLSARGESLGFQLQSHRDLSCLAHGSEFLSAYLFLEAAALVSFRVGL